MNFIVLLFILNILFCGGAAYYFYAQKKQFEEEEKLTFKKQIYEDSEVEKEKKAIEKEFEKMKEKAAFILSESEKLAQELMKELQDALGRKSGEQPQLINENVNIEEQLGFLKEKIEKQYVDRIARLFKQLENLKTQEAIKVEKFAEEQEAITDVNIQKIRVEELEKIHQRIENYKNCEIDLFNEKVKKVVNQAAFDVLGHSLTSGESEELVARAIRKAREDHVI